MSSVCFRRVSIFHLQVHFPYSAYTYVSISGSRSPLSSLPASLASEPSRFSMIVGIVPAGITLKEKCTVNPVAFLQLPQSLGAFGSVVRDQNRVLAIATIRRIRMTAKSPL
jgi:hypothetical protein